MDTDFFCYFCLTKFGSRRDLCQHLLLHNLADVKYLGLHPLTLRQALDHRPLADFYPSVVREALLYAFNEKKVPEMREDREVAEYCEVVKAEMENYMEDKTLRLRNYIPKEFGPDKVEEQDIVR